MSHYKKITLAGVIIFLVFVYSGVSQKEIRAQEEALVVPDVIPSEEGGQTGREILNLLADLKKVKLDESIFADPIFQLLKDTSVELDLEPKGRPNPFAPLGKDVVLDESQDFSTTTSLRDVPFSSETEPAPKSKPGKPI